MHPLDDHATRRTGLNGSTGSATGEVSPASSAVAAPPAAKNGAASSLASTRHLTQVDLARRWRMSERTLEAWRWRKTGPPHLRIGGKVIYRLQDVVAYETAHLRQGEC